MDVALSDFIHSNLLPFNFEEYMNMTKVIVIERGLASDYNPHNRNAVGSPFIDTLYDVN